MNYVRNDILKLFKVKILRYIERLHETHDLANYLPPHLMKGESSTPANWNVRNQEFAAGEVQLTIKEGLPKSIQDELYDQP